jgi:hypothetical protein
MKGMIMNKNYKVSLPLHTKVHVTFKDKSTEELYTNELDWDVIGKIWQVDGEHIWIKKASDALVRYPIDWVNVELLEDIADHFILGDVVEVVSWCHGRHWDAVGCEAVVIEIIDKYCDNVRLRFNNDREDVFNRVNLKLKRRAV